MEGVISSLSVPVWNTIDNRFISRFLFLRALSEPEILKFIRESRDHDRNLREIRTQDCELIIN
jgi:hypothetical protein